MSRICCYNKHIAGSGKINDALLGYMSRFVQPSGVSGAIGNTLAGNGLSDEVFGQLMSIMNKRGPKVPSIKRLSERLAGSGVFQDVLMAPAVIATAKDLPGQPGFPGERHGVFIDGKDKGTRAAFLGPQTAIKARLQRNDVPVNDVDAVAKAHDIAYMRAGEIPDKKERQNAIVAADKIFLRDIQRTKDAPLTKAIAEKAIRLKMMAEKLGVLPTTIFSGGRMDPEYVTEELKKYMEPAYLLKQEAKLKGSGGNLPGSGSKLVGGFWPLLLPLLQSATPYLATALASAAGAYVGKKIAGSGLENPEIKDVVRLMSKIPQTKQVELVYDTIRQIGVDKAFNIKK